MVIVNFQRWSMLFHSIEEKLQFNADKYLDDKNLHLCFSSLVVEGNNIDVLCADGYMKRLLVYLKSNYIMVKAAGGVVENDDGQRLLMIRNERADLPKGKVEDGETLSQAALRETCEETGLCYIELGRMLLKTYHIYDLYGGWHFKQTTWYEMRLHGNQAFIPQTEEGITECLWLGADEWCRRLNDSYATMRLIARHVADNRRIMLNG